MAADALTVVVVLEEGTSQEYAAKLADSFTLCAGVCSAEITTADQVPDHYVAKTQARIAHQRMLLELVRAVSRGVPPATVADALELLQRRP